jgi:tetratricopeptide (TPR) repeat protein
MLLHAAVSVSFSYAIGRIGFWLAAGLAARGKPAAAARTRPAAVAGVAIVFLVLFKFAAVDPLRGQRWFKRGVLAGRDGRVSEAFRALARAGRTGYPGRHSLQSAYMAATLAARAGRHRQAERLYRAIEDRAPGFLDVRYNLALMLLRQDRTTEARRMLIRGTASNPYNWRVYELLFHCMDGKQRRRLLPPMRRAAAVRPWDYELHYVLAVALGGAGLPEAKAQFARAAAICREHVREQSHVASAWVCLVKSLAATDIAEARRVLADASDRFPKHADLAKLRRRLGPSREE